MSNDGHQVPVAPDFEPENGEAAVGVVKCHPLDAALKGFGGGSRPAHRGIIHRFPGGLQRSYEVPPNGTGFAPLGAVEPERLP